MNRDDIVRMAREVGISVPWDQEPVPFVLLERFAEFAAAAEREACARVVEQAGIDGYGTLAAALLVRERGAP
jgi:hypothetical protein